MSSFPTFKAWRNALLLFSFLYARFLYLLWDKPPSWLKPPQSLKRSIVHLGIAIAATFPIATVYVSYLLWIEGFETLIASFTEPNIKSIPAPDVMLRLSWLWLIAAAYIYRWKYQFARKQTHKRE